MKFCVLKKNKPVRYIKIYINTYTPYQLLSRTKETNDFLLFKNIEVLKSFNNTSSNKCILIL